MRDIPGRCTTNRRRSGERLEELREGEGGLPPWVRPLEEHGVCGVWCDSPVLGTAPGLAPPPSSGLEGMSCHDPCSSSSAGGCFVVMARGDSAVAGCGAQSLRGAAISLGRRRRGGRGRASTDRPPSGSLTACAPRAALRTPASGRVVRHAHTVASDFRRFDLYYFWRKKRKPAKSLAKLQTLEKRSYDCPRQIE